MINDNFAITAGVEIELVFAFRQDLLQDYLNSIHDRSIIVKEISDRDRLHMANQTGHTNRSPYMGWGLKSGRELPILTGLGTRTGHPLIGWDSLCQIRTYGDEPMQIARHQLPSMFYDVGVHFAQTKQTDFNRWHLTYDSSVHGVSKAVLGQHLGSRISSWNHWDSHGMELVSPILRKEPDAFTELTAILTILKGTDEEVHGAFVTEQCGMHIHVGLPPIEGRANFENAKFDLATLQHLAYILVMYESSINTVHPRSRRGGSPAAIIDLQSNLDAFRRKRRRSANVGQTWTATQPDNVHDADAMLPLEQVRAMIWRNGMTPASLINLMGPGKSRIVNWSYLHRLPHEGPRTLEFRQHEGTLDPDAVQWWALFVTGLVQLAQHMGQRSPRGAGDAYKYREWNPGMNIFDLLDMMDFPALGRVHFAHRQAFFAPDRMEGVQRDLLPGTEEEVPRLLPVQEMPYMGLRDAELVERVTLPVILGPTYRMESRPEAPPTRLSSSSEEL